MTQKHLVYRMKQDNLPCLRLDTNLLGQRQKRPALRFFQLTRPSWPRRRGAETRLYGYTVLEGRIEKTRLSTAYHLLCEREQGKTFDRASTLKKCLHFRNESKFPYEPESKFPTSSVSRRLLQRVDALLPPLLLLGLGAALVGEPEEAAEAEGTRIEADARQDAVPERPRANVRGRH